MKRVVGLEVLVEKHFFKVRMDEFVHVTLMGTILFHRKARSSVKSCVENSFLSPLRMISMAL